MTEGELDRLLERARRMQAEHALPAGFSWAVMEALPPRTTLLWTRAALACLAALLMVAAVGGALAVTGARSEARPPALSLFQGSGQSWSSQF